MVIELRPYQVRAIAAARDAYRAGRRSVLIVAPTGAGKTIIGVSIAASVADKGGTVLWLAHREELIRQAADAVRRAGVEPGIIAPWASPSRSPIQVASVQTLLAREQRPTASVLVADEAHHHVAEEWGSVAASYSSALRIGLTATPERSDGVGLGNLFDTLVPVAQPRELISAGHLVPVKVVGPARKTRDMAEDPVVAYERFARGRKAIVFPGSLAQAARLEHAFNALGHPCKAITGTTKQAAREEAIDRFRRGRLLVLIGIHTLTEGLDVPDVYAAILARGFSSPGAYIQAVGRVMRPAPGKTSAIVLDLRGASTEHGLPDEDRVYSLEGKAIASGPDLDPIRQCPECGHVFRASLWQDAACPGCGFRLPRRVDPKVRRAVLEQITSQHVDTQRTEFLRRQIAICRAKGWKIGKAMVMYKLTYKHWPSEDQKRHAGWYAAQRAAS